MAQIVLSELAPSDAKHFALANENFDVPYETDDTIVLANAAVHPWLDVKYPEVEQIAGQYADRQVAPADDPLSYVNSVGNDPEAVRAFYDSQQAEDTTPLAVDSGLDQDKAETVGSGDNEVAVTLAADETASTDTTSSKSSSSKKGS